MDVHFHLPTWAVIGLLGVAIVGAGVGAVWAFVQLVASGDK